MVKWYAELKYQNGYGYWRRPKGFDSRENCREWMRKNGVAFNRPMRIARVETTVKTTNFEYKHIKKSKT